MIERYSREEMKTLWEDQARFQSWLDVELAACEVLTTEGVVPEEDMETIRNKAGFDLARIDEIETEVKHDVIAFLTSVAEKVGPSSRFIHFGLTSSDVVDTAQAIRCVRACDLLIATHRRMMEVLKRQALQHKKTVMVGRTHGIHAEPYTLGLKFAAWYAEAARNLTRLDTARKEIAVGKISGAVGTYAHLGPQVEAAVMERLGLGVEDVSTQVVARDRYAAFMATLGILASSLDRIATEIRHLQKSDVREVEEPFSKGQKGSSAMPHKRNPVGCENISGLSRVVRSHVQAALENVALWHERDISHSSVERVIFPDATILCDYMTARMTRILDGLHIYPERMLQNMNITRGLIFSQKVLLALTESGMSREAAYDIVQRNAMKTWAGQDMFRDLLAADPDFTAAIPPERVSEIFDPAGFLSHVDTIYKRVFES
ncbi:MAG: adenylosuccinate lyase [Acidobacteria bacterium]|uniref:Adenylosuccinate lyase n=1 Tax=Candidatus Polarisedimenticola svalbardensis TaxID=2886004 RepID=A0A8J7CDD7_9BACT|nr:adenylosuccinate lyase [Candidatus Polarisedimenticola svalbardensis]